MIARTWKGAVRTEDADAYTDYLQETGVAGYRDTPGNEGVHMLRRDREDGLTEYLMVTLWSSLDAIKGFAGDDVTVARFYPEDDRYLVEGGTRAPHRRVAC
jgi:heme-degrading monooxygenase HmoA